MKRAIIKGLSFILVFIAAIFIISRIMNQGNTDMTVEMKEPTYPLIYMKLESEEVNCLYGYCNTMETSYLRDTITVVPTTRNLSFVVEKYGASIKGISIEVRSVDGSRLIENTQITKSSETDDTLAASITLKDLIEVNIEYSLCIVVTTSQETQIRYYTRIILSDDNFVNEKVAFVKDFHESTFDKLEGEKLSIYLESNAEGDNSTYHKVNIHSSLDQITWGSLDVEEYSKPVISIKEISTQTAVLEIDYLVSIKESTRTNYYRVNEYYRIRYGNERIYLLDFERTMNKLFDPEADVYANNKIVMGIADENMELKECEGGNVLAYVYDNQLYTYNIADNEIAKVFAFYNTDNLDPRNLNDACDIKILSIDETGNVRFMVYGYMNRGRHEGDVGVQIYYYNSLVNTVEEEVYISYSKGSSLLTSEIERLSYVSKNNILYVMLDGTIYSVNLVEKSFEVIVTNLLEESYKISNTNEMIAWQEGSDIYNCTSLIYMNLNTKEKTTIDSGSGNRLRPLGFMGNDLIYGIAYEADIMVDNSGRTLFPMYSLKIQNEAGDVLKSYFQQGIFVENCIIEDNQIIIKRLSYDEVTNTYTTAADDQILNSQVEEKGINTIESAITENYERIVQISVKSTINENNLKLLTPKEVLFEGGRELVLKNDAPMVKRYYIYEKGSIAGIYTNVGDAVDRAYEISGVVVNDAGAYVWQKGNLVTKNQIMAIEASMITADKNSVAVCLDTILRFEGLMRNTEYMLNQGETIMSVLENNLKNAQILDLSGCSLDSVLYYINRDIPVMAILDDQNAVLLIGFNEQNIVIMDPLTGTIYKKGMNDTTTWLLENGNHFITYIP